MTKQKNKKKGNFKMYSQWQRILEFIATFIFIFVVSTIDNIDKIEYLKLLGVLSIVFIISCELIHKYGK